ncbi:MAG: HGxxPAAW family protein [Actinomycetota bacterium]
MVEGKRNSHGSTPAAWTLVVLVTIGTTVSTVALVFGHWVGFWIGAAIVGLGAIVGGVMRAAGLGQKPRSTTPADA